MDTTPGAIAARSRLEAMDWSLALISQGIESTIERQESEPKWVLRVAPESHERALETLRAYRAENRFWRLRREMFRPGVLFDWVSVIWVGLICALHWIAAASVDLRGPGVLDTDAVSHGEWWRVWTAIWLHADVAHLASNAVFGFVLLGLVMGRFGTGVGLLAAYVAGAAGNILSWGTASSPHYALGASGMVMGCLGLLAVQSLEIWRRNPQAIRTFLTSLAGGGMLFVLVGLTPGTDVVAHFGGFVAGLALGAILMSCRTMLDKTFPNVISAFCFACLVIWPWWLALRRTH